MSAYDFAFTSIEGRPLPLSRFQGKVVLVVNTASRCGFTRQYGELQVVWERYRDSGLVVLGVPSNDFGNQEPGTEDEIKTFCEVNFDVDFPMTDKARVRGPDAHPFYQWAAQELGADAAPRWNFHKYLIGRDGRLAGWFSSSTAPTSKVVEQAIERLLGMATTAGGLGDRPAVIGKPCASAGYVGDRSWLSCLSLKHRVRARNRSGPIRARQGWSG